MKKLFALLGEGGRDEAELAERALARRGEEAANEAIARFPSAQPPERGRLVKLVGRFGGPYRGFLVAALADDDKKTRRNAAIALGKLGGDDAELRARWPLADVEERRSLAEALGKMGGPDALALLDAERSDDPELARILGEARLKLSRTLGRAESGRLDANALPPKALPLVFRCREGLGPIVVAEVKERLGAARLLDEETVAATLRASLSSLQTVRTALHFAFPLPTSGAREPGDAVVAALTSEIAQAIFHSFTHGQVRYRIEWASGGHRRGLTFRTAEKVARLRPELVNDPTASLWEAVVEERRGIRVELWPRGLDDTRFSYRVEQVPASSHPTLAAALARLGGARPDDVVWDPFVGGGTELVERARLGPWKKLIGSDLDGAALERARINLEAAGIAADLTVGDARSFRPSEKPQLIVTNPPMGRRVLNKQLTGALYDEFLAHAAQLLPKGGRLVWISPRADDTARRAESLGLHATERRRIDMGGFWAELQAFMMRR
jgi:23S rRNA G2445 N2-methylase RlmL